MRYHGRMSKREKAATYFSNFIRGLNDVGVGASAPFSLAGIFVMLGLALTGLPRLFLGIILVTWVIIAIGNHWIYQASTKEKDALRKPFFLSRQTIPNWINAKRNALRLWWHSSKKEKAQRLLKAAIWCWADMHGLVGSSLKGLVYGFSGYFALGQLFALFVILGWLATPVAPGLFIAFGVIVGIAGFIVQATKLVGKTEEVYGLRKSKASKDSLGRQIKYKTFFSTSTAGGNSKTLFYCGKN